MNLLVRLLKKAYLLLSNIHYEWAQDDAAHGSPNDPCVVASFLREYEQAVKSNPLWHQSVGNEWT